MILGYVLERKIAGGGQWDRISPVHYGLTRYEDYFPIEAVGTYHYRVISVGADSKKSKPSKEITVELLGKLTVPPPFLREVTSKDETVTLYFNATGNKKLTDSFLVVRGNSPDDLGLVIGTPIDGSETSFTDTRVRPGEDYWYGLVAMDKEGNRSKISDKLLVRVIPNAIPKPEKPDCNYKQEPFSQVVISFEPPPSFLLAIVLRKSDEQDRWTTIADNVRGTNEVIDLDLPPSGSVSYAIMYKTEHGLTGAVSENRTIKIQ